jgi:two-component system C4-dicarboxylate transport response regulator DctD
LQQSSEGYRILIVDDDAEMRESLEMLLRSAQWETETASGADAVFPLIESFEPEVILTDFRMPGMDGMALLTKLRQMKAPPVILMTAHGDIPMAVEAIQNGAFSFFEKPFDPRRLLEVLGSAVVQNRLSDMNNELKDRLSRMSKLDRIYLGDSEDAKLLRDRIMEYSEIHAPVMLVGETGTGKELLARAMHDLGGRGSKPFVIVNCASLTADNFNELFYDRNGKGRGYLGKVRDGTLFFDTVCVSSPEIQALLLQLIQGDQFSLDGLSNGGAKKIRVLIACNKNLEDAVAAGTFRRDLYFRLNVVTLNLPPLRTRKSDMPMLFTNFISQFAEIYEIVPPELTHEDIAALLAHDWLGNVRELRHVAERRVLAARRGQGSVAEAISPDEGGIEISDTLRGAVAVFERELIAKALAAHRGRMDATAEALGIGRRTLNEKIVKLGLNKDAVINRA